MTRLDPVGIKIAGEPRGVYAFPWNGRGFRPAFEEDVARLPKIDYSEFDAAS
jgi:hypothetical protein